jgi:hypothetical protein
MATQQHTQLLAREKVMSTIDQLSREVRDLVGEDQQHETLLKAVQEKDAAIRERDAAVLMTKTLQQQVKEKDLAKEKSISQHETLREQYTMLLKHDGELLKRHEELMTKNEELAEKIREKDLKLATALRDMEAVSKVKDAAIRDKEAAIQDKKAAIQERDELKKKLHTYEVNTAQKRGAAALDIDHESCRPDRTLWEEVVAKHFGLISKLEPDMDDAEVGRHLLGYLLGTIDAVDGADNFRAWTMCTNGSTSASSSASSLASSSAWYCLRKICRGSTDLPALTEDQPCIVCHRMVGASNYTCTRVRKRNEHVQFRMYRGS